MTEQTVFIYRTVVQREQSVHKLLLNLIFLGFEKNFSL